MKIISYNVNGIRAAVKKGFIEWLVDESPDVICLQEIKALKEQLDIGLFVDAGYKYNYWFSANKKGYSGVAILSKTKPNQVDDDGFIYVTGFFSGVSADFDNFSITNPDWGNDCQPMGYTKLYEYVSRLYRQT